MKYGIYTPRFSRSVQVAFTERDELAFSRALREFSPQAAIFERDGRADSVFTARVPSIPYARTGQVAIDLPVPGQEGEWADSADVVESAKQSICYAEFRRSHWRFLDPREPRSFDPPLLWPGLFCVWFPNEPELKRFAMRVLRLVDKVSWKPKKEPWEPGPFWSGGPDKRGLAACRWAQAGGSVRRALSSGTRIRPSEDIRLNKYYDDSLWGDSLPETSTMTSYYDEAYPKDPAFRPVPERG